MNKRAPNVASALSRFEFSRLAFAGLCKIEDCRNPGGVVS